MQTTSNKGNPPRDGLTREAEPLVEPQGGHGVLVSCEDGVSGHRLPDAGSVTLGRSEECDIPVIDSSVSRKHAVIHAGDPPTIEDLGSRNGTRIQGRRLAAGEHHPLSI